MSVALVDLELIGDAELFSEPDYALRLRALKVVDGDGHFENC